MRWSIFGDAKLYAVVRGLLAGLLEECLVECLTQEEAGGNHLIQNGLEFREQAPLPRVNQQAHQPNDVLPFLQGVGQNDATTRLIQERLMRALTGATAPTTQQTGMTARERLGLR